MPEKMYANHCPSVSPAASGVFLSPPSVPSAPAPVGDRKRRRAHSPEEEPTSREAKRPTLGRRNLATLTPQPVAPGEKPAWITAGRAAVETLLSTKMFSRIRIPKFKTDTAPEDRDILLKCGLCRRDVVLRGPSYNVLHLREQHALECAPIVTQNTREGSSETETGEESEADEDSEADKENRG